MKLKKCSCCGKFLSTKDVKRRGRDASLGVDLLYFDCKNCQSTLTIQGQSKPLNLSN